MYLKLINLMKIKWIRVKVVFQGRCKTLIKTKKKRAKDVRHKDISPKKRIYWILLIN